MCSNTRVLTLESLSPSQQAFLDHPQDIRCPINPNDPRLFEPQEIYQEEPLTNPEAIALHEASLPGRARQLENCGKFGKAITCKPCDMVESVRVFHCKEYFSSCCQDYAVKETTEHWQEFIDKVSALPGKLIFGELTIRHPERSREAVDTALKQLQAKLEAFISSNLPLADPPTDVIYTPGYKPTTSYLVLRFVIIDFGIGLAEIADGLKAMFTESVSISVAPLAELAAWFKRLIFYIKDKYTPEDFAEQTKLFVNFRRLRNRGTKDLRHIDIASEGGDQEISLGDIRDNFSNGCGENTGDTPPPISSPPHDHPPCIRCGSRERKETNVRLHSPEYWAILERAYPDLPPRRAPNIH